MQSYTLPSNTYIYYGRQSAVCGFVARRRLLGILVRSLRIGLNVRKYNRLAMLTKP